MMPLSLNIQITGNDCRCCRGGDEDGKLPPDRRVIYRRGTFSVQKTRDEAQRNREDEKTRGQFEKIVRDAAHIYNLRGDRLPQLQRGECVKVRDLEELKAWIRGVAACQRPNQSLRETVCHQLGREEGGMGSSIHTQPPTPLKLISGSTLDYRSRVVWDPEKRSFVVKNARLSSFRRDSRSENEMARRKLQEQLSEIAKTAALDVSVVPLPKERDQAEPVTLLHLRAINAWIQGVSDAKETMSSVNSDLSLGIKQVNSVNSDGSPFGIPFMTSVEPRRESSDLDG